MELSLELSRLPNALFMVVGAGLARVSLGNVPSKSRAMQESFQADLALVLEVIVFIGCLGGIELAIAAGPENLLLATF